MISKLTLIAAVVAANEIEEEEELHNHFVVKKFTRVYKFGAGWCGHAGAYTQYADLNGNGLADQTCSDHQGRHWHRLALANGNFQGSVYSAQIAGWCSGPTAWTRFADLTGDDKAEMLCDVHAGGQHWAMLNKSKFYKINWDKAHTKKHSAGWCGHAGSYTQYADVNGDGKVDMTCDDTLGKHWTAFSKGNGQFFYKYQGAGWCGHAGSFTTYADINGDGKADQTCNDTQGRHWSRLSLEYSYSASTYHSANWCKGGITRYSNFWYDAAHPRAADMMCDVGAFHYIRPSLGNGKFHSKTWKVLAGGWCNAAGTHYADINGNGVDDLLCSINGNHWLMAH